MCPDSGVCLNVYCAEADCYECHDALVAQGLRCAGRNASAAAVDGLADMVHAKPSSKEKRQKKQNKKGTGRPQ
jgi:hypothetical protein